MRHDIGRTIGNYCFSKWKSRLTAYESRLTDLFRRMFFFCFFFYSAQWLFVFCLETARSALGDARTVLCVIKVPVHTWAELSSSVTYLQPLLFARQSRAYNCVPNTTVFFYYSDLAGQQAVISNISCVRKWRVQSYRFLSNVSADGVYDIISFGL